MRGEPPPLVLLLLLTALASLVVTVDALRRRPARGLVPFVALTLGTACYALCSAVELLSMTLPEKLFWVRLEYLSVMALPAGLLAFANRYTERKSWLRWHNQILLAVEPVITMGLLWTNDAHHWVWTAAWLQPYHGSFFMLGVTHGPWFWIHTAYSYGLTLWAITILARAFVRSSYLHRRQTAILLLCCALPLLVYTLVIAGWNPFAPIDPTPLAGALAIVLAGWGLRRYRLFDLLPIARHVVVDQIEEGMVVVNADGYIVDVNNAVLRLLGQKQAEVIGQPAALLLPFYDELARRHHDTPDVHEEIVWPANPRRYFDLHRSTLHDRHGRFGGYLFVLHDITVRKEAAEQARERSEELRTLYEIAVELTTPRDLTSLLQLIVQRATNLVQGSSGGVYLYRPEHDDLKYEVVYGLGVGWVGTIVKRGEGLSGRVLESGQAQAIDDYSHWPDRSAQYDGVPLGAVVAVPMQWEGGTLGVLDVGREPGYTFTPEAIRLLTLFANQAALVVARAQLYDKAQKELAQRRRAERELQRRSKELSTLYDTALEVASQLDLTQLLQAITERAMELLQASTGDLSLYRPASDDLEAAVLCGMGRELTGTVLKRGEGMGGKVLETGAPLAVEDYHTWPGRAPAYEGLPFGPMVGAPLKWGGQILGTIDVARPGGPPFTKAEVRLLSLFASQAAVAIANARLYADIQRELAERQLAEKQVRQRSQQLSTLFDTSLEVASRLDLARLLPTIVERAALLLQAVGCDMYLYQPGPDTLEHVVAYGRSEEFLGHILHRGEGLAGKVLDSGEPMAVDDYHHWAGRSLLFEHQDVGAVLAVPVKWGERVLGVIDLERIERDPFNAEDIRLLTLFANQAAIALANAQLYEAARRELVERKSAEAQLRESERYYRAVVEDQTELIYRFTADEQVTFVNDAACRFLGKERQQIIGRSMMSDVVPEEQARVRQALASITHEAPVVTMENRVISGNAKVHWFQWTDRGIFDEQGILTGYQAVGRDICERKRAEATREALQAQLQQAQRMEAVGVLAGGVAHEFNNLLTVIEGNVELALSDLDANQPAWETLATVVKTAQRAAALTRQLLAFSRHQVLQPQELDLNALLANFASLVQPALGPGVKLQLDPSPGIRTVLADARAMEQVLMNLALNARDAMPQGGEIRIATAAVTLDEEFCRTRDKIKPGEHVRLTVADTGTGMDAETLRRMWEPFFTTKEVGKGTGLGLAVVYGIIRQLEGLIEVQSEVGQGTRFDVYLPVFTKQ